MERLVQATTSAAYFKEQVDKALERQKLDSSELSSFYLVHLLDTFVRPDRASTQLGVKEDPSLAELLCRAIASRGQRRASLLKTTGDRSLFISGFFSESLRWKLVDVDYYADMGGYAYGMLARLNTHHAAGEMFLELSQKFVRFADVLNEVSEASSPTDNKDILRLYEKWLRTGSKRSEAFLRQEGLILSPGPKKLH